MSTEFKLDTGDDDGESFVPDVIVPTDPMQVNDFGEEFSPSDMAAAANLSHCSPIDIMMAIFRRQTGNTKLSIRDLPLWKAKDFVSFCALMGSLGSSRIVDADVGAFDLGNVTILDNAELTVLRAALVRPRVAITSMITDGMLPALILTLKGVQAEDLGEKCDLIIPGCPIKVAVSLEGSTRGRVLKGGEEFVAWHNSVYKTPYAYLQVSDDARIHSYYIRTYARVKFTKDSVSFVDHVCTHPIFKGLPSSPSGAIPYRNALRQAVTKAHGDADHRPPIGHSSEPEAYMEALLHYYYQKMSAKAHSNIVVLTTILQDGYKNARASMKSMFPEFFSAGDAVDAVAASKLTQNATKMHDGSILGNLGAVGRYVTSSRVLRAQAEPPKKFDSYGVGCVGAGPLSVAEKISRAGNALVSMVQKSDLGRIDAFGTHVSNHWESVVNSFAGDVTFYDKDRKHFPKSGALFEAADIEQIMPGSKVGRYLFDDTLPVGGDYQSDPLKLSLLPKIKAVIASGYEGGIMKMYLGNASDAQTPIGGVPNYLSDFHVVYPQMVLLPGGSAHSPEWFLVFSKVTKHDFSYPALVKGPKNYYPQLAGTKGDNRSIQAFINYARNWFVWRVYDIIRANISLNYYVRCGYYEATGLASWLQVESSPLLMVNGLKEPDARQDESFLTAESAQAFVLEQ